MLFEKIDKSSKDIVFVYTICGSLEEAKKIGFSSIEEKLAISMDYWIINSIYPWNGVLQEVDQYILMFSTQKSLSDRLVKHIESEHSYNIPMVVVCPTNMTNEAYSMWVEHTLKNEDKYKKESDLIENKDINSLNKLK